MSRCHCIEPHKAYLDSLEVAKGPAVVDHAVHGEHVHSEGDGKPDVELDGEVAGPDADDGDGQEDGGSKGACSNMSTLSVRVTGL